MLAVVFLHKWSLREMHVYSLKMIHLVDYILKNKKTFILSWIVQKVWFFGKFVHKMMVKQVKWRIPMLMCRKGKVYAELL